MATAEEIAQGLWQSVGVVGKHKYPHPFGIGMTLLDEDGYSLIMVSENARILHANDAGLSELGKAKTLQLVDGSVIAANANERGALRAKIDEAISQHKRGTIAIGTGANRLSIAIVPFGEPGGKNLALLVCGDLKVSALAGASLSFDYFARSNGLTVAEARVLSALAQGSTPKEIAREFGVAASTVRTQISSLRNKTGTTSIGHLMSLVPTVDEGQTRQRSVQAALKSQAIENTREQRLEVGSGAVAHVPIGTSDLVSDNDPVWMKVAELLGGPTLFSSGLSALAVHRILSDGLPVDALERVSSQMRSLPKNRLFQVLGVEQNILEPGLKSQSLSQATSSCLWKFSELFVRATALLGTQTKAEKWIDTPTAVLEGLCPLDLLTTAVGSQLLTDYLGRLEYGVFT